MKVQPGVDPKNIYVELADGCRTILASQFRPGQLLVLTDSRPLLRPPTAEDTHSYDFWISIDNNGMPTVIGKRVVVMLVSVDFLFANGIIWMTVLYDEKCLQLHYSHQIVQILDKFDSEYKPILFP